MSLLVRTREMARTTSRPAVTRPKTGCREEPPENQSRFELWATLMKNCEPPESGAPVFAIDRLYGTLESREMFSSLLLPPVERFPS